MKRLLIPICLLCLLTESAAQVSNHPPAESLRIGLSSNTVGNINPNDYMASLKSWAVMVGKEQGLQIQARAEIFDVDENLRRNSYLEQLDAYSLTVADLMFLGLHPESVFLTHQEGGVYIHYAVIVHRDSGITDLAGLKGGKMVLPEGNQMILARQWLTILLSGCTKGRSGSGHCLGELITTEDPSKGILKVFFGQAQATIVARKTFEMACELNPQLGKNLKVLSVSPPLVLGLFMFRPTYRGFLRQRLEKGILELHTSPGGRQILAIYQSSRMDKHPVTVLDSTRQFLIEYQRLVYEVGSP